MNILPRRSLALALAALALTTAPQAIAQTDKMTDPMVGGAAMYPTRTIVENAVNSKDHTTLVAAVKAAQLVDALSGPGPYTVFAPTNAAFDKQPPGTVDALVKPENRDTLTRILTFHVVAGAYSAKDLMTLAAQQATLTTVEGEPLTVSSRDGKVMLTDGQGGVSTVTIADVFQSNGVIHVVDTVLMP
jgi:uncharacterized surface protein with fasciclin (FAS1) repeats